MTEQLTKEQFIKFVEDLYLNKLEGSSISEDAGGYHVTIADCKSLPGRYNITGHGPTGFAVARDRVAAVGIPQTAGVLYGSLTEGYDEAQARFEGAAARNEAWRQAELAKRNTNFDGDLTRFADSFVSDDFAEARNLDEKRNMLDEDPEI